MATFPDRALAWVNAVAARVCEVALGPILNLPPLAGLLILSAITSVVMLLVMVRGPSGAMFR